MGDKRSEYVSQKLLDSFYEEVARDIENNIQDKGVWTKAFAKAGGDENKAKAIYIELMVDEMILEQEILVEEKQNQIKQKESEYKAREKQINGRIKQEKIAKQKIKINPFRSEGSDFFQAFNYLLIGILAPFILLVVLGMLIISFFG